MFSIYISLRYRCLATDVPVQIPSSFEWNLQLQMLASVEDVQQASADGSAVLIDSRDARRYAGLEEPIDAKAGHIPGAMNYFWKDVLGADGRWSGVEALEERFSKLDKDGAIIVYCGSGVSGLPERDCARRSRLYECEAVFRELE